MLIQKHGKLSNNVLYRVAKQARSPVCCITGICALLFLGAWLSTALLLGWSQTQGQLDKLDKELSRLGEHIADIYRVNRDRSVRNHLLMQQIRQFCSEHRHWERCDSDFNYQVTTHQGDVLTQSTKWSYEFKRHQSGFGVNYEDWRIVRIASPDGRLCVHVAVSLTILQPVWVNLIVHMSAPLLIGLVLVMVFIFYAVRNFLLKEVRHIIKNQWILGSKQQRERDKKILTEIIHELKTPVAAVDAQIHLMEKAESEKERHRIACVMRKSLHRSANLADSLLTLSTIEEKMEGNRAFQSMDIARIGREIMACHSARAVVKHINLSYQGPDSLRIKGCSKSIENALSSMLNNALVHCPQGACIEVRMKRAKQQASIAVLDNGPGIPKAERERVFERFFRCQQTYAQGTGLGLTIIKKVAELHHGSVTLTEGLEGRGLKIQLNIPYQEPAIQGRSRLHEADHCEHTSVANLSLS